MANQEQLDILKQGVEACNCGESRILLISVDLSGVDLRNFTDRPVLPSWGANLMWMYGANLSKANLRSTKLCEAKLCEVNLHGSGPLAG